MPAGKKPPMNLAVAAKTLSSDLADDDAFVHGAKTSKRHGQTASEKRRMTIYLPEDVAVALEMHSVTHRESVSGLVEQAVRRLVKM